MYFFISNFYRAQKLQDFFEILKKYLKKIESILEILEIFVNKNAIKQAGGSIGFFGLFRAGKLAFSDPDHLVTLEQVPEIREGFAYKYSVTSSKSVY